MNHAARPTALLLTLVYHLGTRWLPPSTAPAGKVFRRLRALTAGPLLRRVGQDVNIEYGAWFGSGELVSLGNRSGIGVRCRLHGEVTIGDDVMMGPEVLVYTRAHGTSRVEVPMLDQGCTTPEPVTIQDDVWIGARAVLLPGIVVGRGSVVGAGSVVTRSVPPYAVVAGNPARVIRDRRNDQGGSYLFHHTP